jgi:predicted DNA-binding protein
MEEMVSMHHRMPKELRKRLKVASAQRGLAMTDIINQAVEMWLDQEFERMADERLAYGSIPSAVSALVNSDPDTLNSLVRNLPKERIILISAELGADPDPRHSYRGLVNQLVHAVEKTRDERHIRSTD